MGNGHLNMSIKGSLHVPVCIGANWRNLVSRVATMQFLKRPEEEINQSANTWYNVVVLNNNSFTNQ
jgi:hypothetical protein